MAVLQDQLQQVSEKLQLLLKQHSNAQKENEQLTKENQDLKAQLRTKNLQAEKLNEKVDAFNIASMELDKEAKKDLEKRINTYLKEIDKCLALLNP